MTDPGASRALLEESSTKGSWIGTPISRCRRWRGRSLVIAKHDPEFVVSVYAKTFAHHVDSQRTCRLPNLPGGDSTTTVWTGSIAHRSGKHSNRKLISSRGQSEIVPRGRGIASI